MSEPIFHGYLLKAILTNAKLPPHFIEFDTFESTPNQREQLKAYRDDNTRDLTMVTADGMKTVIKFKLRPMWLDEKMLFQQWLVLGTGPVEEDQKQRTIELEFWDDENNVYKTGKFYVPNIKYPIHHITENDIKYKSIDIEFIEC